MNKSNCLFSFLIAFLLISGCSEQKFDSGRASREPSQKVEGGLESSSDANETFLSLSQTFVHNGVDLKPDYLFVIDNSNSMKEVISEVRQGFLKPLEDQVFLPNSKIAAMSTMHADPNDFSKVGPEFKRYQGIDYEPGFLDFVRKDAVDTFFSKAKAVSGSNEGVIKLTGKWEIPVCESSWFGPSDKNENGNYCLTAALQTTHSKFITAEAGILAFEQLLLKNASNAIFREDASVNVIFISDTHHPGIDDDKLRNLTASYEHLDSLARKSNKIRGLKFHALAPTSNGACPGGGIKYGVSYFDLSLASGGVKKDICRFDEYANFMEDIIANIQIMDSSFELDEYVSSIQKVVVNGINHENFELKDDRKTVVVKGLNVQTSANITVFYDVK